MAVILQAGGFVYAYFFWKGDTMLVARLGEALLIGFPWFLSVVKLEELFCGLSDS